MEGAAWTPPDDVLTRPAPPPDLVIRYGTGPEHIADVRLPPRRPGAMAPPAPLVIFLHGVTGCRQRSGHRPGVRTVISRTPEAAVEEYHQWGWRRHGPGPPRREPNVRDVLRAGAIPDHQIRGRRRP